MLLCTGIAGERRDAGSDGLEEGLFGDCSAEVPLSSLCSLPESPNAFGDSGLNIPLPGAKGLVVR